jgi:hypothetical protein
VRLLLLAVLATLALGAHAQPKKKAAKSPDPAKLSCEEQWRLYRESEACFARYRTSKKALRPEAHSRCKEMLQPQC